MKYLCDTYKCTMNIYGFFAQSMYMNAFIFACFVSKSTERISL